MIIAGIDYSVNSPAIVKANLDDTNLNYSSLEFLAFTSVIKTHKLDNKLVLAPKEFKDNFIRAEWYRDQIIPFIKDCDCLAIEGYAMGAKGRVFDIAEATACTKYYIYDANIPLRIHDPNSIKMFATNNGNCKKDLMEEFYLTVPVSERIDLSHLPKGNPKEDIVDAFWIMKLLQTELKLRKGILHTKDLPEHQVKVFNRCTKQYPENILVRDFIQKG